MVEELVRDYKGKCRNDFSVGFKFLIGLFLVLFTFFSLRFYYIIFTGTDRDFYIACASVAISLYLLFVSVNYSLKKSYKLDKKWIEVFKPFLWNAPLIAETRLAKLTNLLKEKKMKDRLLLVDIINSLKYRIANLRSYIIPYAAIALVFAPIWTHVVSKMAPLLKIKGLFGVGVVAVAFLLIIDWFFRRAIEYSNTEKQLLQMLVKDLEEIKFQLEVESRS